MQRTSRTLISDNDLALGIDAPAQCTPENPFGIPPREIPQLRGADETYFSERDPMNIQGQHLAFWLGLPGNVALGVTLNEMGGGIVAQSAYMGFLKVLYEKLKDIYSAAIDELNEESNQRQSMGGQEGVYEHYERMERYIEYREERDREFDGPTMDA